MGVFQTNLRHIYVEASAIEKFMDECKEKVLRMNRGVVLLAKDNQFIKDATQLPASQKHIIAEFPRLEAKEAELSKRFEAHLDEILIIARRIKSLIHNVKGFDYRIIGKIRKEAEKFTEKEPEIAGIISELENTKKQIEGVISARESAREAYLVNLRDAFLIFGKEFGEVIKFYQIDIQSLDAYRNPYIIGQTVSSKFSCLDKAKLDIINETHKKVQTLSEIIKLRWSINCDMLVTSLEWAVIFHNGSFDIKKYLKPTWVTHLHFYNTGFNIDEFPFMSTLLSGVLASGKYLKDNQIKYRALSPGGSKRDYSKPSYSVAFSFGAESQYGSFGFVFNALELIENKIFAIRTSTSYNRFNELHVFDIKFRPESVNSPGAYVDITQGYALIPEEDSHILKLIEQAKKGERLHLNKWFSMETYSSWLYQIPKMAAWWTKNKILFYSKQGYEELVKRLKQPKMSKEIAFGFFVVKSIKKNLEFRGNEDGEFLIIGHIDAGGPTDQGDYTGPLLAYVTNPKLKAELKQEIDQKSGFYDFAQRLNRFVDHHLEELSK